MSAAPRDGNEGLKDQGRQGRLEKPCDFGGRLKVIFYLEFSPIENRLRKDTNQIFGLNSTVNINSKSKLMDVESHFVE